MLGVEKVKTVVPLSFSMTELEDAVLQLMTLMPSQNRGRIDTPISKEKLTKVFRYIVCCQISQNSKYNNLQGLNKTVCCNLACTFYNFPFLPTSKRTPDNILVG